MRLDSGLVSISLPGAAVVRSAKTPPQAAPAMPQLTPAPGELSGLSRRQGVPEASRSSSGEAIKLQDHLYARDYVNINAAGQRAFGWANRFSVGGRTRIHDGFLVQVQTKL